MSLAYEEGEPVYSPFWERVFVLDELDEAYKRNLGQAVIHIVDRTDSDNHSMGDITVLTGLVKPRLYSDIDREKMVTEQRTQEELTLLMYTLLDQGLLRASFLTNRPSFGSLGEYHLPKDDTVKLDQSTASMDARVRDKLKRTEFDLARSAEARERLIRVGILKPYKTWYG